MRTPFVVFLILAAFPLHAQTNWFSEALLRQPEMRKALDSLNQSAIIDEWIRLTEIPAPSGQEQARADYVRVELQKLGLTDIRVDEMFNVSGVRKGTGGGPLVVFAAHLDTVFPASTDVKVKRDGRELLLTRIHRDQQRMTACGRGCVKTRYDGILITVTGLRQTHEAFR